MRTLESGLQQGVYLRASEIKRFLYGFPRLICGARDVSLSWVAAFPAGKYPRSPDE
jgi:hypothetical protein